jgi:hypothetical protein
MKQIAILSLILSLAIGAVPHTAEAANEGHYSQQVTSLQIYASGGPITGGTEIMFTLYEFHTVLGFPLRNDGTSQAMLDILHDAFNSKKPVEVYFQQQQTVPGKPNLGIVRVLCMHLLTANCQP